MKLLLPPWKGAYSQRKEFAPHGSKFFPFRVDPFLKGTWLTGRWTGSQKKSCLPCKNWRKTTKCILTLRYFYLYFRENRVWHVICLLTRQFAQPIRPCILGNTRIQKTYHQIVGYCSKQEEASSSRLRTGLHSDIRELHRIKMLIGAIVSLRKKDEQADLELIFKWRMQNRFGRVIHAWRWQGTQWK